MGLTYYSRFWACSARWTFNVNARQWAVNASQCRVLTHARGNGLSYCVLSTRRTACIPLGVSLETNFAWLDTLFSHDPQRAKHAINDHFHSYAVAKPLTDMAHHSPQRKHWRSLTCKIPKKGAIESSYSYFPVWIIWYSANSISFNPKSILILSLRPYVIQDRNDLGMEWVNHTELQLFNTI